MCLFSSSSYLWLTNVSLFELIRILCSDMVFSFCRCIVANSSFHFVTRSDIVLCISAVSNLICLSISSSFMQVLCILTDFFSVNVRRSASVDWFSTAKEMLRIYSIVNIRGSWNRSVFKFLRYLACLFSNFPSFGTLSSATSSMSLNSSASV